MLRHQSSAGADDWDVFAGVVGSERPGAHPADRGAGQTWLIGQTPSASASGKLLHAAYVPVVARPRTLDRQGSGGGWSRPAYQPQRSFRQAPPPVEEEPNVHAWMADMRLRRPSPRHIGLQSHHRGAAAAPVTYAPSVAGMRLRPGSLATLPALPSLPWTPPLESQLSCLVLSSR